MVFQTVILILELILAMGIILVLVARKRAKEGKTIGSSYHGLYNFGRIIVALSIVLMAIFFVFQIPFYIGLPLFAVGVTFLVVGLVNRNKQTDVNKEKD